MAKKEYTVMMGGRGTEEAVPMHVDSPTWIIDDAWDKVKDTANAALAAYLEYCRSRSIPHSYLLGLDILITGVASTDGKKITDIRPTLLEGPCCNSYPACPNYFAREMYKAITEEGIKADSIEYPVHPTKILDKIVECFQSIWKMEGHTCNPTVAVFTRPYPESEEEQAHEATLDAFRKAGIKAYRITPDENPHVINGKLFVDNIAIDMVYRRIERIHVPVFYGWDTAMDIIYNSPNTIYVNPWEVDSLRSKTIEERCFREWENKNGNPVSRPHTLLDDEINPGNVKELLQTGGFAHKKWSSTGGKGVFLNVYMPRVKALYDKLFIKYDGRHMDLITDDTVDKVLKDFEHFTEDAAIQQMRIIDARNISDNERLVYDTRINCLYNPERDEWDFISGISRTVPCGPNVENGNSLLTNVSSGAEMSALIMGYAKERHNEMKFGPMLTAMLNGETEVEI